ncbi:MAG TPA: thiamine diphosphokinase [Clostridiales bacterium]|nr:thiamine diphosphokinase [Clostridiales bacterium]
MKKGALILSQPFSRYLSADYVIAADKGFFRATEKGIKPDLLVGDMDSLGYTPQGIDLVKVASEKDFSDGELGVRQAALRDLYTLDIYGAIGGRADHFLYNLHLLKIAKDLGISAVIRGDAFDIYYTESNLYLDVTAGDTLSVVPFGESVHIIKAKGLKYPADGAILTKKDTLGLSNVCTANNVFVSVKEGSALLIHCF